MVGTSLCFLTYIWIINMQDTLGANGSAAAADAEVGSSPERRQSQHWQQETPVLWSAGADTEHEGKLGSRVLFLWVSP